MNRDLTTDAATSFPGAASHSVQGTSAGGWHKSFADAIRDPAELVRALALPDSWHDEIHRANASFPLLVPRSYLARMKPGDPRDPLLAQVLPVAAELRTPPGYLRDPVDDAHSRRAPGLLQKYHGRALLIVTGACAVHCRYCFRRNYPYKQEPRRPQEWDEALSALRADSTIHEVLLSGGDPLMLTDERLGHWVERLSGIPHLRRLRIHSRLPVVLPDRVTPELLRLFRDSRLTPIMVVHANHPREIVGDCSDALRTLVRGGVTTLNQSVLLRGVNDAAETLVELSERLIDIGVVPYYLHQLDQVQGAAHFDVDEATGHRLISELRRRLPGYGVPAYVREVAGAPSKTPLVPSPTTIREKSPAPEPSATTN